MSRYINNIKKIIKPNKDIEDEIIRININRVFNLSITVIVMRLISIAIILMQSPTIDEQEIMWKTGLMISHIIYLLLSLILGSMAFQLRKKDETNIMMVGVQYATIITILLVGISITLIDQLVIYSITPFIISCTAIGMIFIIKPLYSLLIYVGAYITYYIGLGLVQTDETILFSNRINGLTMVILGLFLSFVLWSHNVVNLQQRKRIVIQQDMLERKNGRLLHLASYDFLTGLINRRHFEERMAEEISRIKRYNTRACLLILDIDNFKYVNDKYGHPVGDVVLQDFASFLRSQLRESDIVARIGGEEFAILLIGVDCGKAMNIAEKIRKNTEEHDFIIDDKKINITISIGVALLDSRRNSYEEGYRYADRALYQAKSKGKNRVEEAI